ncbi:MAG: glycosyltransferase, partial [Verrucomicrobiae bacterium]|nr:glycosyltransferase [Verrucomicrobiae bacterium]
CPGAADKIHRVYNGIAMDQFPTAPIEDFGPLRIISVGRLIEFKGFHHLVGACRRLADRGLDFHWTLVGEGPWRERLEGLVAEAAISPHVTFAGVQSQESIKRLLAASSVFCLPCIVDSKGASDILPTVITEAMACSLPVVSTHLVGVPEMVIPEETGLLVDPGDESALADALARLANDRGLAKQLGKAGRARAERVFELRETSRQLAGHFDRSTGPRDSEATPAATCLYLLDAWPPAPEDDTWLTEEIGALKSTEEGRAVDATLLSARCLRQGAPDSLPDWPEWMEFFPDALVLEAEWAAHPAIVAKVIEWRDELGKGIDTESYLFQARRALHLARLIEKRGIRHLHASRSAVAVTAWLVHRLTGIGFSFAIEAENPWSSSVIDRLAQDARLVSRADTEDGDSLQLQPIDLSRRLVLGPLKSKLPGQKSAPDRLPVYRSWFRQLSAVLS